jgi:hypothetical protein
MGDNQLLRAIVTALLYRFPALGGRQHWPIVDAEGKLSGANSIEGHWVSSNIGNSARLERKTSHQSTH